MTPTEVRHVPVVVIGAGPTGVTAATLLAQYGIATLVIDRWEGVYPQPRAVHLDDEVMRIIDRLGIAEEFATISRPGLGLRLLDTTHRVLAEFRRSTKLGVHGYSQANMYDQPDLEHLLRTNLKRYPCAEIRGNAEVTEITDNGRVLVTYTDRGNGSIHTVAADYVLGCDGANSLVRNHIGATMRNLRFDQRWLVVDVETGAELGQWDGVHQVCDPDRAATYMRIGQTRYRWEFRLLDTESADDFADLPTLLPLIAPWVRGVDSHRLDIIRVAEYTFRARLADRWRSGQIFLLGDAAHLTPPFIGQGLCSGMRDAMNLAWKLAGVIHRDLPESTLTSYEVERKPHARYMIVTALAMGKAMTAGGRFGNALRRVLVPRLHLIPGVSDKFVDSATPPLRTSALVHRRRGLGGRLCPNMKLANGIRLDTVRGLGFAVITTSQLSPAQRDAVQGRGACAVVAEPGTDLAQWLARHRAAAALVRPDGTVMVAGRDVDALLGALPRFHSPVSEH